MQRKKYIPTFKTSPTFGRIVDTFGDLQLQFDANSSQNTVIDSEIENLKDLKNDYDVGQETAGLRPELTTVSGLKFADFDGSVDRLEDGANNLMTGLEEVNLFFVCNFDSLGSNIIFRVGTFTADTRFSLNIDSSDILQLQARREAIDGLDTVNSTTSLMSGVDYIIHIKWSAATATIEAFLNNVALTLSSSSISTAGVIGNGAENNNALFLGSGSGFARTDGRIGEVLIYGEANKDKVYNYLSTKWGI